MAFTLDSTIGSPTMNCYVAVTEADDYFSARYGASAWASLAQGDKEALLFGATNILETFGYDGLRAVQTQPLKWPRQLVYNDEGHPISSTTIPVQVKQATFELALWRLQEEDRPATDAELQQLKSSKVGPLDYVFKDGVALIPQHVIALLKAIGPGVLTQAPGAKLGASNIVL